MLLIWNFTSNSFSIWQSFLKFPRLNEIRNRIVWIFEIYCFWNFSENLSSGHILSQNGPEIEFCFYLFRLAKLLETCSQIEYRAK